MGFFCDLSKKANDTYKMAADKTNKISKEIKLKSYMNNDKEKIEEIYIQIGKKVYEKHIREENINIKDELSEECAKIDAYAKEIEDIENELRSLKGLRLCKVCAAEINLNAKFCPMCGAKQEQNEQNMDVNIVKEENASSENVEKKELEINEASED